MSEHPPLPAAQHAALDEPPVTTAGRRLSLAFQAVFGQEGRNGRSTDQRLVIKHLRKCSCADSPVFQTINGVCDPYAAAQRDGARTITLIIDRQLELARAAPDKDNPKTKLKVKR